MNTIDDPDVYNPYGWRLAQLGDPTHTAARRQQVLDELLICEAEEIARGYRHLTIVHGDPTNLAASRHLSDFYETLREHAGQHEWVRLRGSVDYVTITVRGADVDRQLAQFEAAAHSANPGEWRLIASPRPPTA